MCAHPTHIPLLYIPLIAKERSHRTKKLKVALGLWPVLLEYQLNDTPNQAKVYQIKADLFNQGHSASLGILQCPETLLVIMGEGVEWERVGGCPWHLGSVEARAAAKHPTLPRTALTTKNHLTQVSVVAGG